MLQHRFMMSTLREFGFGKSSMEEVINEEVEKFRAHLERDDGRVVCVQVRGGVPLGKELPSSVWGYVIASEPCFIKNWL